LHIKKSTGTLRPQSRRWLAPAADNNPLTEGAIQPLAGGTTLIDLMKLDVMRAPRRGRHQSACGGVVTINLEGGICGSARWRGCRMLSQPRNSAQLSRGRRCAQARRQPATAKHGDARGNVLQRTRCSYFRDVSYDNCNSATRDPAAPRCKGSTARMPCSGHQSNASQPTPAISRKP